MTVPFKGRLASHPFPAIFIKIASEHRSGVLSLADIETKEIKKRIGFKGGNQVYVSGGTINETLGRLMVKWKMITGEQYHEALSTQKEKKIRAGDALLNLKLVTPQQLGEALQRQTEEKLMTCFDWTDGLFSFIETEPPKEKTLIFFKINPNKILVEGIKHYMANSRVEELIGPLAGRKLHRTDQFESLVDSFDFKPQEARLIQIIKSGMTLPEILSQSGSDDHETLKIIYILLTAGALEPEGGVSAPSQAPAQPPAEEKTPDTKPATQSQASANDEAPTMIIEEEDDVQFEIEGEGEAPEKEAAPETTKKKTPVDPRKDSAKKKEKGKVIEKEITSYEKLCKESTYFELLGVDRDAKSPEIKKAYFKLAKKFHPDTNPDFFKGDFKDRAEEIFTSIGSAYNTLIDKKAKGEYVYALDHNITQEDIDKANAALESESIFVTAEVLMRKGDFRGAMPMIEEAITLNPEEPEYYVYRGWAKYKSSHGKEIAEARKDIQKALNMNLREKIDDANYYLGMLAKVEGLPASEMEKHFQAAVDANPQHTMASSELRHLHIRGEKSGAGKAGKPEKKKGLFGRFKK